MPPLCSYDLFVTIRDIRGPVAVRTLHAHNHFCLCVTTEHKQTREVQRCPVTEPSAHSTSTSGVKAPWIWICRSNRTPLQIKPTAHFPASSEVVNLNTDVQSLSEGTTPQGEAKSKANRKISCIKGNDICRPTKWGMATR